MLRKHFFIQIIRKVLFTTMINTSGKEAATLTMGTLVFRIRG